jgi:threonine dehydrogenase-like Zn-dependent dehydrogenase
LVAIGGWQFVNLNLQKLVGREISIKGTLNYSPEDFNTALEWLVQGVFDPGLIITDEYPLSDGARIFNSLSQNIGDSIKTILTQEVK